MRGHWLDRLLEVLPLPLKGVLLILVGMILLSFGWLDLKNGRGLMRVTGFAFLGFFSLACGVALLIVPSGATAP